MATIKASLFTDDSINMHQPREVDGYGGSFRTATSTNYSWTTTSSDRYVEIEGTGLTYTGTNPYDTKLTGGTISKISIETGSFWGAPQVDEDIVITDTGSLNPANIDRTDPRSFWNEVLKGDDVFL